MNTTTFFKSCQVLTTYFIFTLREKLLTNCKRQLTAAKTEIIWHRLSYKETFQNYIIKQIASTETEYLHA